MNGRKAKEQRNVPPHVHCYVCHSAISGETYSGVPVKVVVPAGDTLTVVPRVVPVCDGCREGVVKAAQEAAEQQAARSRLIVPSVRPPKVQ